MPPEAYIYYMCNINPPGLVFKIFKAYVDANVSISEDTWLRGIKCDNNIIKLIPTPLLKSKLTKQLITEKPSTVKLLLTRVDIPEADIESLIRNNPQLIINIKNPSKTLLNIALIDQKFINNVTKYNTFVKNCFKNNTVLMNKWLRYAENMRELG
jgi:hypothetical protein